MRDRAASQLSLHSPLGELTLREADGALVALDWGRGARLSPTPLLSEAKAQLESYFDGDLRRFDLPLSPEGSDFQRAVWHAMAAIPYGEVRSYGEIARAIGSAARAVGGACAANPLPVLIPCHRVVAANGAMGGYSGGEGLATKGALLRLEGAID